MSVEDPRLPSTTIKENSAMKISEKQLAANRRNSKRSSGPKTLEGKNKVAKNALKHGIFEELNFVSTNNFGEQNEFREILKGLNQEWMPQGQTEIMIVRKLAIDYVRLYRLLRYEAAKTQEALEKHQSTARDSLVNYLKWGDRSVDILEDFEDDPIAALNCLADLSDDSEEMNLCKLRLAEKMNNWDNLTLEEQEELHLGVLKMASHIRQAMDEKRKSLHKLDRTSFVNSFLNDRETDKVLKYENSMERLISRNIEKLLILQKRRGKNEENQEIDFNN